MSNALVVIFDCDGVILDSNALKNEAFAHCLRGYSQEVVIPFLDYQRKSFGKSRYKLFEIFFSDYLKIECSESARIKLLNEFSEFCSEGYPRCELTAGARETLDSLRQRNIPMYIASGSDELELNIALEKIGIAHYFVGIFGSPASKSDNLRKVKRQSAPGSRFLFIGDAEADYNASIDADIPFVYLSTWAADKAGMRRLKASVHFREESTLEFLKSYTPLAVDNQ